MTSFGFAVEEPAVWYWDNFTDPVFGFAGQPGSSGFDGFRLYSLTPSGYSVPEIWSGFDQESFVERVEVGEEYAALVEMYDGLDRLISQYEKSTNLRNLIWEKLDLAYKNVVEPLTQIERMLSLDYAVGIWLDLIGERIGLKRIWASWESYADPVFGFEGQTEATGFDGGRIQTVNPDLYVRSGIDDEVYRALLRGRGVAIWAPPTRPNLEFAVKRIFGDTVVVGIGEHSKESYGSPVFGFAGQPEASGFDQNRLHSITYEATKNPYFGFAGQDGSSGFDQYGLYSIEPLRKKRKGVTIYIRGTVNEVLVDLLNDHKIASKVLPIAPNVDIYWDIRDIDWVTPEWFDAEEAARVRDTGYISLTRNIFGFEGQPEASGFDGYPMETIIGPIWERWELYPVFGFAGQVASSGFDQNRLYEIAERRN